MTTRTRACARCGWTPPRKLRRLLIPAAIDEDGATGRWLCRWTVGCVNRRRAAGQ